jgi:hypothetical protein
MTRYMRSSGRGVRHFDLSDGADLDAALDTLAAALRP